MPKVRNLVHGEPGLQTQTAELLLSFDELLCIVMLVKLL